MKRAARNNVQLVLPRNRNPVVLPAMDGLARHANGSTSSSRTAEMGNYLFVCHARHCPTPRTLCQGGQSLTCVRVGNGPPDYAHTKL